MKKKEVESILLVNKYLLCNEEGQLNRTLIRRYLTHKVNKALTRRQTKFSIFSLFIF